MNVAAEWLEREGQRESARRIRGPSPRTPLAFLALAAGIFAAACGARSELALGPSVAGTGGGGGRGGAGGSCAGPQCTAAPGPGAAVWSRLYGSAGQMGAAAIAVDGEDGLVVAGLDGYGVADFGCGALAEVGATGMFVVRLDRCRACTWSRAFDGVSAARVVVKPAGHVVVGGSFQGGSVDLGGIALASPGPAGFVAELDGQGTPLWARSFPGVDASSTSYVEGLAVDAQGAVLVAGTFAGSIDFGGTLHTSGAGMGAFAGKLGPGGTPAWSRAFGPNVSNVDLAAGDSGEFLLTGSFETPVDFGCGSLPGLSSQVIEPFVAALDASGACRWTRWFTAPKTARAVSIAAGSSQVVVSGSFSGTIDLGGGFVTASVDPALYVAALGADGSFRWGRGVGSVLGGSLAMNAAGDVFLTGELIGPVDLGGGPFGEGGAILLGSLDPAGGFRWGKAFAQPPGDSIKGAIATAPTRVLIAGGVANAIDFGCGPLSPAGGEDVFVAELAP